MFNIAGLIKKIIPGFIKIKLKNIVNFYEDYVLYKKYSTLFEINSFGNKEALLILNYHGIEKGFLFNPLRPRFAREKIINMHGLLCDKDIVEKSNISQIYIGYNIAVEYYDLHESLGVDISDYYHISLYNQYKQILNKIDKNDFKSGKLDFTFKDFYREKNDFLDFAHSRKSIRNYTGEKFELEIIRKAIKLANTAPSVCNRQATKVYLLENKEKIDYCLDIQGGFNGYIENVKQLLIVTVDRNYFYTTGERNQFYIDGGIYLLNLLYALHYYKISACPANWGKDVNEEKELYKKVTLPKSEKIICMIPVGKAPENFSVTLSYRRDVDEVLKFID